MKGQSLFELVLVIGVVSLVLVGLIAVSTRSVRNSTFSRNNVLATRYSQEGIEWLRGERDRGWTAFRTNARNALGTYCLNTLSWALLGSCTETITGTIFTRSVTYTCHVGTGPATSCNNANVNRIRMNLTTSWTDSQGAHNATLSTDFTRWK